ncbi:MAG: hypothetical protein LBF22_13005 [Deltaproteobacteria bacterium]|jgi:hypothetical protein|nr:hypothetical protein [Deltaproteobacteria bacterium]
MIKLDLSSISSYQESVKQLTNYRLASYRDVLEVERDCENLNVYPGLKDLERPRSIHILEEMGDDLSDIGKKAVLNGDIYWEHTAAGEGTRLQMGPKFFITSEELKSNLLGDGVLSREQLDSFNLLPLELGRRHLLQQIFEIRNLALEAGLDPKEVLHRQKMLIIAADETMPELMSRVHQDLGGVLPLENLRFMIQASFPGLDRVGDIWDYVPSSPKRLHNHGAMVMQKSMDRQIFTVNQSGELRYFTKDENFRDLESNLDLVSYNIEDLDYLTRALDFESMGLAIKMRSHGYAMMMEIAANNPERPIKGGLCAFDPTLKRDVMVESIRLKGYRPEDIHLLNKNFNHYLNPSRILNDLVHHGLFMPVVVKDSYVYFQPVQGDLNFMEKTLFFTRKKTLALNSLKSKADILFALKAFQNQDNQMGFRSFVEIFL